MASALATVPDREDWIDCLDRIERVRLDGETILHSCASGAAVLLNDSACMIWDCLRATADRVTAVEQLARSWQRPIAAVQTHVDGSLDIWRGAGLFAPEQTCSRTWLPEHDYWPWHCCIGMDKRVLHLRSNDAGVGAILERALAPLVISRHGHHGHGAERCIELVVLDGVFVVGVDGRTRGESEDFAGARHTFLKAVVENADDEGAVCAVLHAGAVGRGGRAVVLAGESGAGKSTLLASLVLGGCDYLADDLAGLSPDGSSIIGLGAAISVKPGSTQLIGRLADGNTSARLSPPDEYDLSYLTTSRRKGWHAIELIVLVGFDAGMAGVEVSDLAPAEALRMLLHSGTQPCAPANSIEGLARLCQSVPAVHLRYGDGERAAGFIRERLHP